MLVLVSRHESLDFMSVLPVWSVPNLFPPDLLLYWCEHLKNISFLRSLRQGMYLLVYDRRFLSSPLSSEPSHGSLELVFQDARLFAFAVTLRLLVYFRAFSICSYNPPGISDIPTKSSANVSSDTTVSSLTLTLSFRFYYYCYSTSIRSLMDTF